MWILWFLLAVFLLIRLNAYLSQKARRNRIYLKYGRTESAEKIIKKTIWIGETAEQLRDSLGKPLDIDENVLKTKRKEVWKYHRKSASRYGLKIKIENGIVIGWDQK